MDSISLFKNENKIKMNVATTYINIHLVVFPLYPYK